MFCTKCGYDMGSGVELCPSCGTTCNLDNAVYESDDTVQISSNDVTAENNSSGILTGGIFSFVFGLLSFVFSTWFSIPGLIISVLCAKKVKKIKANHGDLEGSDAAIGAGLNIAGLILNIIGVVFLVFSILLTIFIFCLPMIIFLVYILIYILIYIATIVFYVLFYLFIAVLAVFL